MRVLITGITGFVGPYMADVSRDWGGAQVFGLARWRSDTSRVPAHVTLIPADITDEAAVTDAIRTVRPDYVFHLAAQSYVPDSWSSPWTTLRTNIKGTVNVLEAVRKWVPDAWVMIAGSSEEYGLVELDSSIQEHWPLRPRSPYGVSKVAQDLLGLQYAESWGLHVVRTRAFNHCGPGQSEKFLVSDFCRQKVLIERGEEAYLHHGALDSVRDFTDVRDIVKAYWLANGSEPDVYNIGSDVGVSVKDVALMMDVPMRADPARVRPSDVPLLIADSSKFRRLTAWKPEIPFSQSVEDTLRWWRGR